MAATLSACAPDVSTPENSAASFLKALNGGGSALGKLMTDADYSAAAADCEKRQTAYLARRKKATAAGPGEALAAAMLAADKAVGTELLMLDCQRIDETNRALATFVGGKGGTTLLVVIPSEKLKKPGMAGFLILPPGVSKEQAADAMKQADSVALKEGPPGKWMVSGYETSALVELLATGVAEGEPVPTTNLWYGLPHIRHWAVEQGFKPPRATPAPEIPEPIAK